MSKNISQLSRRKGINNNLFVRITDISDEPSSNKIKKIAKEFLVGEAIVYGATSFYDYVQGDNANKKAYVCNGSSCLCAGTQDKVLSKLQESFSENEIGHVTCLGRCHENSAFQVEGVNYSGKDITEIETILNQQAPSEEALILNSPLQTPILTADIGDVSCYYLLFSALIKQQSADQILETITNSGLRGRGGAGFPTGFKWKSCRDAKGEEKYIVCNAGEGDPGAFTDRYLLEEKPHAVLFGMLVAGRLSGAQYGILYIRNEYPESVIACEEAIKEFQACGISQQQNWTFHFKIIRGAGAYICGEETALLRSIEGQRPFVSVRPPFPTQEGLFGQPTILNSVETFASIHWILEHGAEAFRQMGNGKSTGTKLISLDSCFKNPGVYEVSMSTPLKTVIEDLGKGFSRPVKALHIGGPLGGLVPLSKVNDLSIDFESFSDEGFSLGHAGIIGIPETMPIIHYLHHLFEFTVAESCGNCFPGRLGATRGKEMLRNAIEGKQNLNKELLDDLLETMEQGSLCGLGGGVQLPVKNAIEWFSDELKPYFKKENNQ
ncbi:MAG: NADH-ubiquinone oxidoreductase-F iron-sulfur binding region domain-containing protein [Planctomycetota bacterium]|jgi:NADH-quinone oxidoreductase subunit F